MKKANYTPTSSLCKMERLVKIVDCVIACSLMFEFIAASWLQETRVWQAQVSVLFVDIALANSPSQDITVLAAK
jgi:hypothetical protein